MRFIQRSFAGGEISPALYARHDQAKYRVGVKTAQNFIPLKTGEVALRNGVKYSPLNARIAEQDALGYDDFRMFPLQAYGRAYIVLAFGSSSGGYYQIYDEDGVAQTVSAVAWGTNADNQIDTLRMAQGDPWFVLTSDGNTPRLCNFLLGDNGGFNYTFAYPLTGAAVSTTRVPAPSAGLTVNASVGTVTLYYGVTSVDKDGVESLVSAIASRALSLEPSPSNAATFSWTAVPNAASYRVYRFVANVPGYVGSAAQGNWVDFGATPDFSLGPPEPLLSVPNVPDTLQITAATAGVSTRAYAVQSRKRSGAVSAAVFIDAAGYVTSATNAVTLSYIMPADADFLDVYRGDAGVGGAMYRIHTETGIGARTTVGVVDSNLPVDTRQLTGEDAAFYPNVAAFVQQRLAFAFPGRPGTVMLSNIGDYTRFMKHPTPVDDDAVEFTVQGGEAITAMGSLLNLTLFSDNGDWLVNRDGSPITPNNVTVMRQGYSGSIAQPPAAAGQSLIVFEGRGSSARSISFTGQNDTFKSADLSAFAAHLSEGHTIVSSAFSRLPNSALYAVRDDGVVLCLTYVPDHEIVAWSTLTMTGVLAGAKVQEVMVLPQSAGDRVYFRIREVGELSTRDEVYYMDTLDPASRQSWGYLDFYVDTPDTGLSAGTVISGLDHLNSREVWVYDLASGSPLSTHTVFGGSITVDPALRASSTHQATVDGLRVGVAIDGVLETLDIDVQDSETLASLKKRLIEVTVQVRDTGGFLVDDVEVPIRTTEVWNEATSTVTGKLRQSVASSWDDDCSVTIANSPCLPCRIQSITFDVDVGA